MNKNGTLYGEVPGFFWEYVEPPKGLTHLFTETENNGGRFSSETIFLITRHGKKKNDKDETGNVLLNLICFYPSIA